MFNKKVLAMATAALNSAKPPAKKKDIIVDPRGQWEHPGEVTRIPGNDITMQGVPYPVYGVDNTGYGQMMYPGQDYTFPGDYVDEYPIMQKGGQKRGLPTYSDSLALYNFNKLQRQLEKPSDATSDAMRLITLGYSGNVTDEGIRKQKILQAEVDRILKSNPNIRLGTYAGRNEPRYIKNRHGNLVPNFKFPTYKGYINAGGSWDLYHPGIVPKGTWKGLAINEDYSHIKPKGTSPAASLSKFKDPNAKTKTKKKSKAGWSKSSYKKKYPPIYLSDPNDPRIGSYAEAGNQYLYKPVAPKTNPQLEILSLPTKPLSTIPSPVRKLQIIPFVAPENNNIKILEQKDVPRTMRVPVQSTETYYVELYPGGPKVPRQRPVTTYQEVPWTDERAGKVSEYDLKTGSYKQTGGAKATCPEGYTYDPTTKKCMSNYERVEYAYPEGTDIKDIHAVHDLWPTEYSREFTHINEPIYIKPIQQKDLVYGAGDYQTINIYPDINYKLAVDPSKAEGYDKATNTYYVPSENTHQYKKYKEWEKAKELEKQNLAAAQELVNTGKFKLEDINDGLNKKVQENYANPAYLPEGLLPYDQFYKSGPKERYENYLKTNCPECSFGHGESVYYDKDFVYRKNNPSLGGYESADKSIKPIAKRIRESIEPTYIEPEGLKIISEKAVPRTMRRPVQSTETYYVQIYPGGPKVPRQRPVTVYEEVPWTDERPGEATEYDLNTGTFKRKKGGSTKSSKYSRSLEATNKLFHESHLMKKSKSKKKKIYDPYAKYLQEGGMIDQFHSMPSQRPAFFMGPDGEYVLDPMYEAFSKQKADVAESNRKAQEFNQAYAQSKNYERLLRRQGYTPEEIQKRIGSVMNINDFRYTDTGPSWVGGEDVGKEFISYNVTDPGDWPGFDQIAAHEWGHVGVDTGNMPLKPQEREQFINRIKESEAGVTGNPEDLAHDMEPQENRADLTQLRQQLQETGVFDSRKKKRFTAKDLENYKKMMQSSEKNWNNMWNRMFRLYDDKDIIWFINNVAQNDIDSQGDDLVKAQVGYAAAPMPRPITDLPEITVKEKKRKWRRIKDSRPEYAKGYYDPWGVPDNTLENIVEIFDPTGMTSWDDVIRAKREFGKDSWQANLERLGAVPLVGKAAKTLKALKYLPMTARQRRSFNTSLNTLRGMGITGRGTDAYQAYDEGLKQKGGFQDDINKRRRLLTDWTYGTDLGLTQAQEGVEKTAPTKDLQEVKVTARPPQWIQDQRKFGKDKVSWWEAPFNWKKWGLNDYSDYSSFNSAFRNARESGEKEFVYKGERYNTELIDPKQSDIYWKSKEFVKNYYKDQPISQSRLNAIMPYYSNYKYGTNWLAYYDKVKDTPEYNDWTNPRNQQINDSLNMLDIKMDDPEFLKYAKNNQYSGVIKDLYKPSYFSITDFKPNDMRADGYWDPKNNKTFMVTKADPGKLQTTYVHELSHKADDYLDVLNKVPKIDIKAFNEFNKSLSYDKGFDQADFDYVSDPSEIEARKLSTLFYLSEKGRPYKSGKITMRELDKLYNEAYADKLPYDIDQLLMLYGNQREDLLKYLNSDYNYNNKPKKKYGGLTRAQEGIEYNIGDEVDEATMLKLKQLGYKFE